MTPDARGVSGLARTCPTCGEKFPADKRRCPSCNTDYSQALRTREDDPGGAPHGSILSLMRGGLVGGLILLGLAAKRFLWDYEEGGSQVLSIVMAVAGLAMIAWGLLDKFVSKAPRK